MRLMLLLFLCTFAFRCGATEQIPDKILVDGQEHILLSESPFGSAFSREAIFEIRDRQSIPVKSIASTANRRGYVAVWEIGKGRLILRGVYFDGMSDEARPVPLMEFFPGRNYPLDATWYSGTIIVGKGEPLQSSASAMSSRIGEVRYSSYLNLKIENGNVLSRETYEAADVARTQEAFRPSAELIDMLKESHDEKGMRK